MHTSNTTATTPVLRRPQILIALFSAILYALWPTKNYYWDGISFAQHIEDAAGIWTLFHPNHLIYNLFGWIVYHIAQEKVRALYLLQALNIVFGSVSVYLFYGLLARLVSTRGVILVFTGIFAFSGTWWRFVSDADAYILSTLLLIALARELFSSAQPPRPLRIALLHSGAILVHQLAVLVLPAVLLGLHIRRDEDKRHRFIREELTYILATAAMTIAAYGGAYTLSSPSPSFSKFISWSLSHSADSSFSFDVIRNLLISCRSWFQLFWIGRPSLVHYNEPSTIALLVLLGIALLLLIWSVKNSSFHLQREAYSRVDLVLLLWIGAYVLFLFVWLPHNTFYKIFPLPAVLAFAARRVNDIRVTPRLSNPPPAVRPRPGFALLAVLALWNLTFGIIPYSRLDANQAIEFAWSLRPHMSPGDRVYYRSFNTDNWAVRYFNPGTEWKALDDGAVPTPNPGRPIWLDTTALDFMSTANPSELQTLQRNGALFQLVNPKHRIRFLHSHAARAEGDASRRE